MDQVIFVMERHWGGGVPYLADLAEISEKKAKDEINWLISMDFARLSPLFDEDTHELRGKGYLLTRKGEEYRQSIVI